MLATLSKNPRAGSATQTYGVGGQTADVVRQVVEFLNRAGVPARMRIVPGALTSELADTLSGLGLRHADFHTILWAPLPLPVESHSPIEIREVSTQGELDAHIDVQLRNLSTRMRQWGHEISVDSTLRSLRGGISRSAGVDRKGVLRERVDPPR